MPRFFVEKDNIKEDKIYISGSDAHHIARSLRMAEGDSVTVCDGCGTEYECTLSRIRDEECECSILSSNESERESPVNITLCMAYPKGDKLEVVIQKAVELGASRIIPFESSRCIKRPKAEKVDKQLARLAKIAEEAAKQCGRARIPEVTAPMSYREMLTEAAKSSLALLCYEDESKTSIKSALSSAKNADSISVIVGSEGGFSPEEAEMAKSAGCVAVSLGKRILRCETAPSFALSAIAYELELS
ncbi:MAG: 16S rRNA (uracil(1498)-N(3))-methyltransferase [Clostridia bacterium]|nr:16S rRNA (uracil(1498)-N(3))-methyltransferase [Clostridia bacterium]